MKYIEEAVAYLESMFSEYPNPTRKVGYIGKIAEWGLKPEQVDELISKAVDRFTSFPTIRHLIDLRDELFKPKHQIDDAEMRELRSAAEQCYGLHIRGLCGTNREKRPMCKHCEGKDKPGMRPETFDEMMALHRQFKGEELEQKYAELNKRVEREAEEDMHKFDKRKKQPEEVGA